MKDIKISTTFKKIQYWISWLGFILAGFIVVWIIALFLYSYGKNTSENKEKKKDILNMTYQKFIFIYGSIFGDLIIFGWILNLVGIF